MVEMVKYVAAGFLNDAERLLRDFMKENSMEFPVFAEIWKKHDFSLIYAARPNRKELREFTLEIFQLSVNFLKSSSLLYQVGGTYLLYGLYRNQILHPPLRIRITLNLFKTILTLLEKSRAEKIITLHYVICYLIENSFDFVACLKLKGPNSVKNDFYKDSYIYHPKIQESDIKYELTEIAENNVLREMDQLFAQYKEGIQSLNSPFIDANNEHPSFADLELRINKLLNSSDVSDEDSYNSEKDEEPLQNQTEKDSTIGSRRALIKAAAFSNPTSHNFSQAESVATSSIREGINLPDGISPKPPKPLVPIRLRRPVRRGPKKVGRPKKLSSDDLMSEEELQLSLQESFRKRGSGRRRRKPRGPEFSRIRNYSSVCDIELPSTSNYVPKEHMFSSDSDTSLNKA